MSAAVYALLRANECPPPAQKRTSRKSVTPCGFLLCFSAARAAGEARLLDSGALLLCVSRELYARCSLTACLLGARLLGARLLPLGSAPQRLAFIRLVHQPPHRSAPHRSWCLIGRLLIDRLSSLDCSVPHRLLIGQLLNACGSSSVVPHRSALIVDSSSLGSTPSSPRSGFCPRLNLLLVRLLLPLGSSVLSAP